MNFASLFYDEIFKLITADYIAVLSIWVQTLSSVFSLLTYISQFLRFLKFLMKCLVF